ncbi:MAG: FAD-dependent oxidoreductase, partial [Lentisphaerae bacterium]|nr:FAD-dependent oxidoreductase [Lentisphaerota bacterium]
MPDLVIDGRPTTVPDGSTILDAARSLGIEIPTLCYSKGIAAGTSCYVCAVRVDDGENLVPSCATQVRDGMTVDATGDAVVEARRMALELLLSDHIGDCVGPCETICPAHMDIPRMVREIADGDMTAAIRTVKAHIPLPAVLGRICPAPCEKGCRRGTHDEAVSIMLLKRAVADADLAMEQPFQPACLSESGKRVAIIGSGPAGLSAAYYLSQRGHACTIYDEHDKPGGKLLDGVSRELLPLPVLEAEIAVISSLGVEFRLGERVEATAFAGLRQEFDAVLIAAGELPDDIRSAWDVTCSAKGINVDSQSAETSLAGVFAAGDVVRSVRRAVNAVAAGRGAALAICRSLGTDVQAELSFNSTIGKLKPGEAEEFMPEAAPHGRVEAVADGDGLTGPDAQRESRRCLHCDCRAADDCGLRIYAEKLGAKQRRFRPTERSLFRQIRQHASVVYEPGKCIKCGLCTRITETRGEELGLSFVGRGFDVHVGVPFSDALSAALTKTAEECV